MAKQHIKLRKNWENREFYQDKKTGYWISTTYPRVRAHVWVWIQKNGPIPSGYHIHHKDEDKSNNDISNLEILPAREHLRLHMTPERRQQSRENVKKAIAKAPEWHKSEAGRAWHVEHVKVSFGKSREKLVLCLCSYCNKEFSNNLLDAKRSKFCTNACKSANRRKLGIDDIEMECSLCNKKFFRNKYRKKGHTHVYCGKKCAAKGRWQSRC